MSSPLKWVFALLCNTLACVGGKLLQRVLCIAGSPQLEALSMSDHTFKGCERRKGTYTRLLLLWMRYLHYT
jgi:hypothetical protein